jgi:hypothetical protein
MIGNNAAASTGTSTSTSASASAPPPVVFPPIAAGQDLLDTAFVVLRRDYTEQIRGVLAEHHHPSATWEDFRNLTVGMLAKAAVVGRSKDFLGERLVFRATYHKEPCDTFLMTVILGVERDGTPRLMGGGGKRMAYMLRFEREGAGNGNVREGPRERGSERHGTPGNENRPPEGRRDGRTADRRD